MADRVRVCEQFERKKKFEPNFGSNRPFYCVCSSHFTAPSQWALALPFAIDCLTHNIASQFSRSLFWNSVAWRKFYIDEREENGYWADSLDSFAVVLLIQFQLFTRLLTDFLIYDRQREDRFDRLFSSHAQQCAADMLSSGFWLAFTSPNSPNDLLSFSKHQAASLRKKKQKRYFDYGKSTQPTRDVSAIDTYLLFLKSEKSQIANWNHSNKIVCFVRATDRRCVENLNLLTIHYVREGASMSEEIIPFEVSKRAATDSIESRRKKETRRKKKQNQGVNCWAIESENWMLCWESCEQRTNNIIVVLVGVSVDIFFVERSIFGWPWTAWRESGAKL